MGAFKKEVPASLGDAEYSMLIAVKENTLELLSYDRLTNLIVNREDLDREPSKESKKTVVEKGGYTDFFLTKLRELSLNARVDDSTRNAIKEKGVALIEFRFYRDKPEADL